MACRGYVPYGMPASRVRPTMTSAQSVLRPLASRTRRQGTVRFDNTCSNADGINPVNTEMVVGQEHRGGRLVQVHRHLRGSGYVLDVRDGTGVRRRSSIPYFAAYKDPVDPTQCVCPSSADAQDAAVAWYSEPPSPSRYDP